MKGTTGALRSISMLRSSAYRALNGALKFVKLHFKFVERRGGMLDVGQCQHSMLILVFPFHPRSNCDRVCVGVELPPTPMRKQVAVATR